MLNYWERGGFGILVSIYSESAGLRSLLRAIGIEIVDGIGLHHNRLDILLLRQSVEYFYFTGSENFQLALLFTANPLS